MILVTGITGKSGSWFMNRLSLENKNVKHLKFRFLVRNKSKIDRLNVNDNLSIEYQFGDLEDEKFLNRAMKNISTVLHIADIALSLKIVKAAINHNVNRLILVHTTGIYSKYKSASHTYLLIEEKIKELVIGKNIAVTILRPTMIYGNINDGNIAVFIKLVDKLRLFPVVNHAKYFLQPVNAKDLGDAYYQVLINPEVTKNKNYILSGKEPILLIDIFRTIGKILGKKNKFISIPFPIAYMFSWIVFLLSFGIIDYRERVQRLIEPRHFPHSEATKDFNYSPMPFKDGIKEEIEEYKIKKSGKTISN